MTALFVLGWVTCVVMSAVLMPLSGRRAWEGALGAVFLGPVMVLLALVMVVQHQRAVGSSDE